VLRRLCEGLPPGGALAVQMPDNLNEPVHELMRETAAGSRWTQRLGAAIAARDEQPRPEQYYELLKPHVSRVDIWHTIYNHPLDGAHGIVEWIKGTGLRPFLNLLEKDEQEAFLADYTSRIAKAYPARFDGKVLLRFPRLFILAVG